MTDIEKLSLHQDSRFWQMSLVKWWIQGHGRDGYSFLLLLVPLVIVFMLEFVCVMFDALYSGIVVSAVATLFLGIAGFHGTRREWLVTSAAARALVKARMKKAAERFSSLGVGATVLAINSNDGTSKVNPSGAEVLYGGDKLVLMGTRTQLDGVTEFL